MIEIKIVMKRINSRLDIFEQLISGSENSIETYLEFSTRMRKR